MLDAPRIRRKWSHSGGGLQPRVLDRLHLGRVYYAVASSNVFDPSRRSRVACPLATKLIDLDNSDCRGDCRILCLNDPRPPSSVKFCFFSRKLVTLFNLPNLSLCMSTRCPQTTLHLPPGLLLAPPPVLGCLPGLMRPRRTKLR